MLHRFPFFTKSFASFYVLVISTNVMFSQTSFDIRKILSLKKYLNKRAIIITQFKYAISNFGTKKTGLLNYKNSMIGTCLYILIFNQSKQIADSNQYSKNAYPNAISAKHIL